MSAGFTKADHAISEWAERFVHTHAPERYPHPAFIVAPRTLVVEVDLWANAPEPTVRTRLPEAAGEELWLCDGPAEMRPEDAVWLDPPKPPRPPIRSAWRCRAPGWPPSRYVLIPRDDVQWDPSRLVGYRQREVHDLEPAMPLPFEWEHVRRGLFDTVYLSTDSSGGRVVVHVDRKGMRATPAADLPPAPPPRRWKFRDDAINILGETIFTWAEWSRLERLWLRQMRTPTVSELAIRLSRPWRLEHFRALSLEPPRAWWRDELDLEWTARRTLGIAPRRWKF